MILFDCDSPHRAHVKAWKTPLACTLRLMDLSRADLANSKIHNTSPYHYLRSLAWMGRAYFVKFV